ncbi:hypothetical protein CERSUDRAFT_68987 [Gelatoporia subvermispora B]|uniref:Uncharacterized protein n=1 Tax=Ceriporiopsis subvermispora (strain B) TaxID=914234 RepID=M2QIH4_CERS8|nr:hypothetical protein CERSUDRAFT_68987 [Gelatoporia subvermispora B]
MRWRFVYSLILLIFPALALVAFVIVSVKLDAIRPFDSITCDVSHTVQIRLLSYAGFPLIFAVPSFLSTCVTAMRLYQSQLHSRRGPYFPPPLDNFTPLPTRRQNRRPKRSSATLETLASSTLDHHSHFPDTEIRTRTPGLPLDSTLVAPPVPAITVSALSVSTHAITTLPNTVSAAHPLFSPGRAPSLIAERRQYHLPFSWKPPIPRSSSESRRSVQNRSSETPSPMMFAPPSDPPSLSNTPAPLPVFPSFAVQKALSNVWKKDAMWEEPDEVGSHIGLAVVDDEVDVEEASRTSPRWARNSDELSIAKSELRFAHDHQAYDYEEFDLPYASSSPIDHSAFPPVQPESPPAHQSPKVWRLLFFQLLSSVTQILASVSSLVDITTHRDMPTPFGTQHVALLLAAWAPCIAFGVQPWGRRPPS